MKKLSFIFVLFLSACTSENQIQTEQVNKVVKTKYYQNQQESKSINMPLTNYRASIDYFENLKSVKLNQSQEDKFIKQVRGYYKFYFEYNLNEDFPLINRFKFLELNGDGKIDAIYFGPSGGEASLTAFHFSDENGYKDPIDFYQFISNLNIVKDTLKTVTIIDPGCCADFIERELHYRFDDQQNPELIHARARVYGPISERYTKLDKPIEFVIESDYNKLRGEPKIDDTSTFSYENEDGGNTIAIFKKGHKGKAWFIDYSDPERDWWYVEMEPTKTAPSIDLFSYLEIDSLHRIGWMSNKYLKALTDIVVSKNKRFPEWLKTRFPDTVNINYAYGYATYKINNFVEINDSQSLAIVTWDDAVCSLDSAFVFNEDQLTSKLRVGHVCENPSPDLSYVYQEYSLNEEVIKSITYKEYIPDSIERKLQNGEEVIARKYMLYDTIVKYYKVDLYGQFVDFKK